MPYPPQLVAPMRAELVQLGVEELLDADAVDRMMDEQEGRATLVIVNSVCGCAAAMARPAVRLAMQAPQQPDQYVTVFAGQHLEATARMREYLQGIPPSSPFMALLKDGDPVFVLERRHIEGRSAQAIAMDLVRAYARFCGDDAPEPTGEVERPETPENGMPRTFRSIL